MQAPESMSQPQCTAKSKRSGKQCKNLAMHGSTKCRMHGGKSLRGTLNPNFKHGKYSKYLPPRLAERYAEALDDPALLELREEIAVIDARITELLHRVDGGESKQRWQTAVNLMKDFTVAQTAGDIKKMDFALANLSQTLRDGLSDHEAWDDVHKAIEQRKRLVESERKRHIEAQQYIRVEQNMVLIHNLIELIKSNVTDKKALMNISDGIRRLTTFDPAE